MQPSEAVALAPTSPTNDLVPLGSEVNAAELARAFGAGRGRSNGMVSIDLRDSRRFDVVAMLHLLSLMSARVASDRLTRFRLPTNVGGLRTLRLHRFLEAAGAVAGVPPQLLLALDDLRRWTASKTDVSASWRPESGVGQILRHLWSEKLFGLTAYRVDDRRAQRSMINEELKRWSNSLALTLFRRRLKGREEDVARVVVHELIANVIRERLDTTTVVVASDMDISSGSPGSRSSGLTIAVWDDGASVVETLRRWLVDRSPAGVGPGAIRSTAARGPRPFDTHRFRLDGVPRSTAPEIVSSDWSEWTLSSDAQPAELLLSSIIPGGPSVAASIDSAGVAPAARPDDPLVGCGLYFLYRYVIDVFDGSLELYAGSESRAPTGIRIDADPRQRKGQKRQYRVRLAPAPALPMMRGNIVVARLPAKDDT